MITVICIIIFAICKALSDTLAWHYEWFIQKFPKLTGDFWKINVVSKKVKTIFKYPIDAWHISGSIMIAAFIFGAVFYKKYFAWFIEIPIGTVIFIIVFNTFYNRVFISKKAFKNKS
jgi:hypothetical protein